jgi:carboxyl-terminal processing protease
MNLNPSRILIGGMIVLILLSGTCAAGFVAGQAFSPDGASAISMPDFGGLVGTPVASTKSESPQSREELFRPFWQAWDLVHDQYVDQPVDDELLMRGAIQGMLDSLGDDHTAYMDPVTQDAIDTQLQGEYEGIGAIVDTTVEYLTIVSTYPDTPAEKAGLEPGDQIIAVDGEDMTGVDPELVRREVIGPAGTKVKLTIQREDTEEPFDVEVTRAKITLPNVESEMLEGDIGYVLLYTFGDRTARDLRNALRELMAQQPKGLILDLRNNGGGYLHVAIDVASEFVEEGVVVYEQYGDGTRETFEAEGNGLATEIPLVVLINAGSASASEIVAGAIQDYDRAELVGETSFGKGSVQIVSDLMDDQGAVRITIARWLTPEERTIHGVGLEPDVKVDLTDEDVKADRDPQLDKAVEILSK